MLLEKLKNWKSTIVRVFATALVLGGLYNILDPDLLVMVRRTIAPGDGDTEWRWYLIVSLWGPVFHIPLKTLIGVVLVNWGIALIAGEVFRRRLRRPKNPKMDVEKNIYKCSLIGGITSILAMFLMAVAPLLWLYMPHSKIAWMATVTLATTVLMMSFVMVRIRNLEKKTRDLPNT